MDIKVLFFFLVGTLLAVVPMLIMVILAFLFT
mgnify:CR=1 FL=1